MKYLDMIGAVTLDEFAVGGRPGTRRSYFRGFLAMDIGLTFAKGATRLSDHERRALAETAKTALMHSDAGRLFLTQKRHGDMDYEYYATKARGE